MGILNKRNAFLGWIVWKVVKRVAKRKALGAVPGAGSGGRSKVPAAALGGLAAALGALWFWRRGGGDGEDDDASAP